MQPYCKADLCNRKKETPILFFLQHRDMLYEPVCGDEQELVLQSLRFFQCRCLLVYLSLPFFSFLQFTKMDFENRSLKKNTTFPQSGILPVNPGYSTVTLFA